MSQWEDTVRSDVRKKLDDTTAERVLKPAFQSFGRFERIKTATPDYPTWLWKNDRGRHVEITASVHDFQRRRTNYFDTIRDLLRHILYYDTGLALLNELDATNKVLYIRPYRIYLGDELNAKTFPIGQDGEVGTLEAWLSVTSTGMPIIDHEGKVLEGSGRGQGLDTTVEFSPDMFGTGSAFTGPGSQPDEVLFHEMVHASRMMRGRSFALPVNQGYGNEEEYISVVLTNVYLSEKGQTVFRANHDFPPNRALLRPDKFLDNVQGVDLSPSSGSGSARRTFTGLTQTLMPHRPLSIRSANSTSDAWRVRSSSTDLPHSTVSALQPPPAFHSE